MCNFLHDVCIKQSMWVVLLKKLINYFALVKNIPVMTLYFINNFASHEKYNDLSVIRKNLESENYFLQFTNAAIRCQISLSYVCEESLGVSLPS